jgi:hypothetical protein
VNEHSWQHATSVLWEAAQRESSLLLKGTGHNRLWCDLKTLGVALTHCVVPCRHFVKQQILLEHCARVIIGARPRVHSLIQDSSKSTISSRDFPESLLLAA